MSSGFFHNTRFSRSSLSLCFLSSTGTSGPGVTQGEHHKHTQINREEVYIYIKVNNSKYNNNFFTFSNVLDVCFYLSALHFAAPWRQGISELVHLRRCALPSCSPGRSSAKTQMTQITSDTNMSPKQVQTHIQWRTACPNTLHAPPCVAIHSHTPADQSMFSCCCILQITGNPIRPVHDLMSTLISINLDTRSTCKSCEFHKVFPCWSGDLNSR